MFNKATCSRLRSPLTSQVDDFGLRKRADSAGKRRESQRILQENTGIPGNGSSFPAGNYSDFFRRIPVNFLCVPTVNGRNTASMFQGVPVFSSRNRPVLIDLGYCRISPLIVASSASTSMTFASS